MAVQNTTVDPIPLFTSIDDEKHVDLNETDDFDSEAKLELEDSIQSNLSDSGTEDDDSVYRFDKKSTSYGSARRFFNKSSAKTWKGSRKTTTGGGEDTSKEYFTLQFDDIDDKEMSNVEKVPVKKGKSLKESIESLLLDRSIDFSTHSVFVESSKTPLPLAFDTFPLGGNVLHVKENQSMQVDERIITLMKSAEDDKRVQSQRPRKNMPSIFSDAPDVSDSINNKHQTSVRKSGVNSAVPKDENRSLSDLLNNYTLDYFDTENDVEGYENSLNDTYLEESWTDIITEYEGMTSKDKIQQEAIWELLITERNYLRKIRVIIMVFKNCLVNIQKENFLEDVDIDRLFSNIKEVYDANYEFWENHLRHVTEEARATKNPIKPSQLSESFGSFEELFQPYIKYCMEETSCVKYLKQLKRENDMFQEYLAWCENHRQCMRLKLADLFVKPMQRVTKYALLLKAVLSKTSDEDERNALENMVVEVDRFVTKINTTLRLRNEQQKLDSVLERIDTYNPIEAANEEMEKLLETYFSNFDLHGNIPGLHEEEQRCILLDGPMKIIEKQGRSDVHIFLFTDVLVLAKAKKGSDKFRIIHQPFRLNKVTLHPSKDAGTFIVVYLNEYHVLVTAFTLQCAANELTKWVNAIRKAKKRYEDARAAQGSTLDFFDDDLPLSSSFTTSYSSPSLMMPRSVISEDSRSLDPSSSINRDDLRCRSSEAVTRPYQKPEDAVPESHVKRSFSDPKAGINYSGRERSSSKQKDQARPKSLVNISDHDIATWVLTNENSNQSGSLTSDISDESQRSSGIGDSFRSINSDISKVAQLKARFENNRPVNIDGSDSSVSTPSIFGFTETSPASSGCRRVSPPDYMDDHLTIKEGEEQCINNTVLAPIADSDKDTENDSSESLRTLNDSNRTLRLSNRSYEPTMNFPTNTPLNLAYSSTASQTEHSHLIPGLESNSLQDITDSGVQCELLLDNRGSEHLRTDLPVNLTTGDHSKNTETISLITNDARNVADIDTCENSTSNDASESLSSTACKVTEYAHTSTQCDNMLIEQELPSKSLHCKTSLVTSQSTMTEELKEFNDMATQYELLCNIMKDTSTQCGDFVQLVAKDEEMHVTETIHTPVKTRTEARNCPSKPPPRLYQKSLSDEGSASKSNSPFMGSSTHSDRPRSALSNRKPVGILKHSYSDTNMGIVLTQPISCSKSQGDEPQQKSFPNSPENKHRNNSAPHEFPGMYALQTLSESLESSIQNRLSAVSNSKLIIKEYGDDNSDIKLDEPEKKSNTDILLRCNSDSTSLRKLAILNNSPLVSRKELHNVEHDELGEVDSFNEDVCCGAANQSSPKLRNKIHFDESQGDKNKRFTWHDCDSSPRQTEEQKYGHSRPGKASTLPLPLNKTISKSSEIIGSTKKSSLKRSIIKKFTGVFHTSDESRSSSFDQTDSKESVDDKSVKKTQKKERKRLKK